MENRNSSQAPSILRGIISLQKEISQPGIEIHSIMQIIVDGIQKIMNFSGAIIEVLESDYLIYKAVSRKNTDPSMLGLKVKKDICLSGTAMKTGKAQYYIGSENAPNVDQEFCRRNNLRSMIIAPFETKSGIAGVLKVLSRKKNAFNEIHELIASIITQLLANTVDSNGMIKDIHRKKKYIQKQILFFQTVLENLSDGVLVTNEKKEIIAFNGVLKKWCGISHQPGIPFKWPEHMYLNFPMNQDKINGEQLINKVITEGKLNRVELRLTDDLPEKVIFATGEKIVNEENQTLGCIIVFQNVTEQFYAHKEIKELNQNLEIKVEERTSQFKRTMEELQKAINSRDDFLSIASHELKTPITSLKLLIEMRQRDLSKSKEISNTIDIVNKQLRIEKEQLNRISRLVEDMLDITRIGAEKLSLKKEKTVIRDLIINIIHRYLEREGPNQVNSIININEKVTGNWDKFRIEQVLCNLLSNSVKYGLGRPIEINAYQEENSIIIEVKDYGIGISIEDQKRIFERFERVLDKSEISGLGLGLYIAQEIVKKHSGSIEVRSELGSGSVFTVKLPLDS